MVDSTQSNILNSDGTVLLSTPGIFSDLQVSSQAFAILEKTIEGDSDELISTYHLFGSDSGTYERKRKIQDVFSHSFSPSGNEAVVVLGKYVEGRGPFKPTQVLRIDLEKNAQGSLSMPLELAGVAEWVGDNTLAFQNTHGQITEYNLAEKKHRESELLSLDFTPNGEFVALSELTAEENGLCQIATLCIPLQNVSNGDLFEIPVSRPIDSHFDWKLGSKGELRILVQTQESKEIIDVNNYANSQLTKKELVFGFDHRTTRDPNAAKKILEEFGPDTKLLFVGYADGVGPSEYNTCLSLDRAKYVSKHWTESLAFVWACGEFGAIDNVEDQSSRRVTISRQRSVPKEIKANCRSAQDITASCP